VLLFMWSVHIFNTKVRREGAEHLWLKSVFIIRHLLLFMCVIDIFIPEVRFYGAQHLYLFRKF
jgi:hypothetical protein